MTPFGWQKRDKRYFSGRLSPPCSILRLQPFGIFKGKRENTAQDRLLQQVLNLHCCKKNTTLYLEVLDFHVIGLSDQVSYTHFHK